MGKIKDPGFGHLSNKKVTRLVNEDGTFNIKHVNKEFSIKELYSRLITMSWWKFLAYSVFGFILINILFASVYFSIGLEQLSVGSINDSQDFINAFFFSAQTVTTLGYGTISPVGNYAGWVSSFEALIGLLCFSLMTGLLYGRFSKPSAAIRFSDVAVLRPFKENRALMFRLMNQRKNIMIEPEINVTLAINAVNAEGEFKRQFFQLELERKQIMYLPTTWTIVHEIDKESPLVGLADEEIAKLNAELFILIQYYEDDFAQKVYQIHSYDFSQIVLNKKFVQAYYFDQNGNMIIDHNKLSAIEPINGF